MANRTSTRTFWDGKDYRYWEEPSGKSGIDRIEWSKLYFLGKLLPVLKGKSVLELGCGPGVITPFLASTARTVLGLDFSENAIASARKRCASIANVAFVAGDALEFECNETFDVITGSMFLHEIMHENTPAFLERLDQLMGNKGFLCFHENSYFNPIGRFIRERLVGRHGIPKHGSDNEIPFDEGRYRMYCDFFRYCERTVDGVELARKVHEYLSPVKSRMLLRASVAIDRRLTTLHSRTGWFGNWSYTQTIFASQTMSRKEVFKQ